MRSARGVPIAVRAETAAATVLLTTAMLVVLWCNPVLWWRASAAIPWLSTWGFIAALLLLLALAVILPTMRLTMSELGLAPRQLIAALGLAAALWTAYHLVQVADVACCGRAPTADMDVIGDLIGAYAEELIYRVVVLGAIATALRRRIPDNWAIALAILGSALLFWLAHLPRDLVTGDIADPMQFAFRVGLAVLMSAIYLSSGNVMLATVVHALVNGPMLVIGGAHHATTTTATSWLISIALVIWYQRRLARSAPAKHG